jgi:hypothetical protein
MPTQLQEGCTSLGHHIEATRNEIGTPCQTSPSLFRWSTPALSYALRRNKSVSHPNAQYSTQTRQHQARSNASCQCIFSGARVATCHDWLFYAIVTGNFSFQQTCAKSRANHLTHTFGGFILPCPKGYFMTTMAQAIREFLKSAGGKVTAEQAAHFYVSHFEASLDVSIFRTCFHHS